MRSPAVIDRSAPSSPSTSNVRPPRFGNARSSSPHRRSRAREHAAVSDDEDAAVGVGPVDVGEPVHDAGDHLLVVLEPGRSLVLGQVVRPPGVDLRPGQPGPGAPSRSRKRASTRTGRSRARLRISAVARALGPGVHPGAGPEIDHVIGRPHQRRVVLDDDDRVALVPQRLQDPDQPVGVAGMQPDRRFVEHEQRADEPRPERRAPRDPLRLAARQRPDGRSSPDSRARPRPGSPAGGRTS